MTETRASLQWRLAWRQAAMLCAVLLLLSAGLLAVARLELYTALDHDLHRDAESARQALVVRPQGFDWREIPHPPGDEFETEPFIEIWSASSELLFRRQPPSMRDVQWQLPPLTPGYSSHGHGDQRLRIGVEPLFLEGAPLGTQVRVVRSEAPLQAQMAMLAAVLATLTLLLTAGTAALSVWITRRSLQPLASVIDKIEHITLEQPGTRLVADGESLEIAALAAGCNRMLERIEASYRQLDRFAADCAHELRTPLTALRLRGEQQLEELPAGPARTAVEDMLQSTDHMVVMVNRLLALARAESRRDLAQLAPIDLAVLAAEAVEVMLPLIEDKGCRASVSPGPCMAQADRRWVVQMLIDLLHNACKAAPAGSVIEVRAQVVDEHWAELSVQDAGPGISDRALARLHSEGDKPAEGLQEPLGHEGTGLGLRITRRLAQLMGGSLRLERVSPTGTVARIRLRR